MLRFTPTGVGIAFELSAVRSCACTVHPHGRGDCLLAAWHHSTVTGSPPRAWGLLAHAGVRFLPTRFTPTGVGIAWCVAYAVGGSTVHPHGRGDCVDHESHRLRHTPVHPHGRGDCCGQPHCIGLTRFTPTGVGIARSPMYALLPHGSPPRAWGLRPDAAVCRVSIRFTPTGVGIATWSPQSPQDRIGSPPRAWGLRSDDRGDRSNTVHPHGRGDCPVQCIGRPRARFTPTGVGIAHDCASLPRNRLRFTPTGVGIAVQDDQDAQRSCRFTPTGVGIAASRAALRSIVAVHPHGRGDCAVSTAYFARIQRFTPTGVGIATASIAGDTSTCGSPPRAWGLRALRCRLVRLAPVHPHGRGDCAMRQRRLTLSSPVHPHGRGDCQNAPRRVVRNATVHPHGRGDCARDCGSQLPRMRFTPTGVGIAAHVAVIRLADAGSPPRAWGLRMHRLRSCSRLTVHPHGRGDCCVAALLRVLQIAVHPHGRGDCAVRFRYHGFMHAVHPHGRGDCASI